MKNSIRSKEQNYLVVYPFDNKILYRFLTADEIKSVRRSQKLYLYFIFNYAQTVHCKLHNIISLLYYVFTDGVRRSYHWSQTIKPEVTTLTSPSIMTWILYLTTTMEMFELAMLLEGYLSVGMDEYTCVLTTLGANLDRECSDPPKCFTQSCLYTTSCQQTLKIQHNTGNSSP